MPEIEFRVYDAADPTTLIATLDNDDEESESGAFERQWLDQLNDPGSLSFKLHAADPVIAANPGILSYGNIVRAALNGTDRFAAIIETRAIPPAPPGEEAERDWTVFGRGVLALLEDAIVFPEASVVGSTVLQRPFDWTAAAYDDTSWIAATEIQEQGSTTGDTRQWYRSPGSWPDPTAVWIWSRAKDAVYPTGKMPVGTSYFRQSFTLAAEMDVAIFASGDNRYQLWLDGEQILEGESWRDTERLQRRLGPGTHQLAVTATNDGTLVTAPDAPGGPAGLLVAIYESDPTGALFDLILHTDSTWVALDYPVTVPGMSIGMILRLLIEEAQDRGALPGITLGFTDTDDTNSEAWAVEPDIALDIGTNLLDVMQTFIEQYVDVNMTPELELQVYNKATFGSDLTASVSLEVGEDFEEESTDGEGHLVTSILARATTGELTTRDAAPSGLKRKEAYLELALAPNIARAQDMSDKVLEEFSVPVVEVNGKVTAGSGPYEDWNRGDKVLATSPYGTLVEMIIISLAISEDAAGHPIYSIEGTQDDASS